MKKAAEILKEMGFRKDAPEGLKEAFVRHLIKSATGIEVQAGPNEAKQNKVDAALARSGQQLSFDFAEAFAEQVSKHDFQDKESIKKTS